MTITEQDVQKCQQEIDIPAGPDEMVFGRNPSGLGFSWINDNKFFRHVWRFHAGDGEGRNPTSLNRCLPSGLHPA